MRIPRFSCVLITCFCFITCGTQTGINNRPVIALVGQKLTTESILKRYPEVRGKLYVAASYVKFLEAAGARVLPVRETINSSDVYDIFYNTNGVVFPGGHENLYSSGYEQTAKAFLYYIKRSAVVSDMYPMVGICLGMEQEAVYIAKRNVFCPIDAYNIGLPLLFKPAVNKSKLFKDMPMDVRKVFTSTQAAFHSHVKAIDLKSFNSDMNLQNFFDILSTSRDRNGVEFVTAIEAKNLPIFGLQWHPEKTRFEWSSHLHIDHSRHACRANQYIGDRIVNLARQNSHVFPRSWEDRLIYRYKTLFTGDISRYEQIYIL